MTSSIDDLFSPDRLRGRWRGDSGSAPATAEPEAAPLAGAAALHADLTRIVEGKKGTRMHEALRVYCGRLRDLLARRFPEDFGLEVEEGTAEDPAALNPEIDSLLSTIEDLLDASRFQR